MAYRQILEALERAIPNSAVWVVSTFPRGATQVVQPAKVSHSLLKGYTKEYHKDDRATWQSIRQGKPLTEGDLWDGISGFEASRYYREMLVPSEICHVAAAPLASPIFPGYPGSVHVYRNSELGPFSSGELTQLGRFAKQIDQAVEAQRITRQGRVPSVLTWIRRPPARLFVFDSHLKPLFGEAGLATLEDRVRDQMMRHAKTALSRVSGEGYSNDRICLPDARGDLWIFRAVAYGKYPGLTDGSAIFYAMQPDCREWATLRPADVAADAEMSRMVPAMQFMYKEYGRGPTLNEIAEVVKLSPFHFHRRFTEVFGITPKHFLLECQIHAAKTHMALGDKTLVEIANSCGFAHQSHFTSRFKQASGLTPTGWRKLLDDVRGR